MSRKRVSTKTAKGHTAVTATTDSDQSRIPEGEGYWVDGVDDVDIESPGPVTPSPREIQSPPIDLTGIPVSTSVLKQHHGRNFTLYNGDSCDTIKGIPDDSVGLSVYSPPFESLYTYSASERDMGNSASSAEFFHHYKFLIPELLRITIPGRLTVVHCKDLPLYYGRDGAAGLRDFPGEIIRAYTECGWTYHSRVTIWKDPVTEMERTKSHGLLYKSLCADSCNSRQGMADYLLVFRKWNDTKSFPSPVTAATTDETGHPTGSAEPGTERFAVGDYLGTNRPVDFEGQRDYSIQVWRRYASPVWFDIDQMDVLNYRAGRETDDEKHICPLQLGVIRRCVQLWSNPGDVVFTPFLGIGSEVYVAVEMGRRGIGIELKESYFDRAVKNCLIAEREAERPMLPFMNEESDGSPVSSDPSASPDSSALPDSSASPDSSSISAE